MDMRKGDTELLIQTCRKDGVLRNQAAYILGTAFHETAHTMKPVRETLATSDEQAKARLSRAWKDGKLSWVKADYWSGGFFGRGYVQLTHKSNYVKAGKKLGVDLVGDPSKAMEHKIAAQIIVRGMMEGWFTKYKLPDFVNLQKSDFRNARKVVNGMDRAAIIAGYAEQYDDLLKADGYGEDAFPMPTPRPEDEPVIIEKPVVADPGEFEKHPAKSKTVWSWLLSIIAAPFLAFGNLDWRVQIAIVVVVVALGIYAIKRRHDLFKAVRDLKKELG